MQIQKEEQKTQSHNKKIKTDLKQRAYRYSLEIIIFLDFLPKDTTVQVISRQLLRSATSIGANIIEAHGSSSKKDFANFFTHALKSANETKYWLGLLRDSKRTSEIERIEKLLQETIELANIIAASLMTMRGRR